MKLAPNVGSDRSWVWRSVLRAKTQIGTSRLKLHDSRSITVSPQMLQTVKPLQRLSPSDSETARVRANHRLLLDHKADDDGTPTDAQHFNQAFESAQASNAALGSSSSATATAGSAVPQSTEATSAKETEPVAASSTTATATESTPAATADETASKADGVHGDSVSSCPLHIRPAY
jgi:hypothetical protein